MTKGETSLATSIRGTLASQPSERLLTYYCAMSLSASYLYPPVSQS